MSPLRNVLAGDDVAVLGWGEAPSWGEDAMVLAPSAGRWHPSPLDVDLVEDGQLLGEVRLRGTALPVTAPHRGYVHDQLVLQGHPVDAGQPLVWLTRA